MNESIGPHLMGSTGAPESVLRPATSHEVIETAPGVELRAVVGHSLSLAYVTLEPGAVAPIHRHAHEQIGFVIEGEMEFDIDGRRLVVRVGDGYVIPPDVPHGARAGAAGARAVEAFVARPTPISPSTTTPTS